jgi:hypothetical protein
LQLEYGATTWTSVYVTNLESKKILEIFVTTDFLHNNMRSRFSPD